MKESITGFEQRKADHIKLALLDETEATGESGLDAVSLIHDALPDLNFEDVCIESTQLDKSVSTPFLISSMTAGHQQAIKLNARMLEAADAQNWAMGVGSQRRELFDEKAHLEWRDLRKNFPDVRLFGNIGISQAITAPIDDLKQLVGNIEAQALQVHLNPLQECIQPEGTPQFKGGYEALEQLVKAMDCPIVVKETGCGMSATTIQRLNDIGVQAIDVAGYGGTHWGRIEGLRAKSEQTYQAAVTFKHWGISTFNSLKFAASQALNCEIWGSGGVRNGLDAAKVLALGATTVGFAKPIMQAAQHSTEHVIEFMQQIERELKVALFCTGSASIRCLKERHHALL